MDVGHAAQPSLPPGALGLYADANAAFATDTDAGSLNRHLARLGRLTGCDLILVYDHPVDENDDRVLVGHWGVPPDRLTHFERVTAAELTAAGRTGERGSPTEDARLNAMLEQSGMRMQRSFPMRSDGAPGGRTVFCSRHWAAFHHDVLSVFASTTFDVGHALVRQRASSAALPHQASQSVEIQQQFIALLAHELRNPIAPIRSGLDLIASELLDAQGHDKTIATMRRQLDHLVRLIDDLLDTVRLRSGKLRVKREAVVLREVLRSAIESIRPALFAKYLALKLQDDPSDVVLHVDPVRLSQAFVNVLNANVKHTPEGGVVSITVTAADDEIHVAFEDEAPGVDPERLDTVFELFPDNPQRHAAGGLGIGLALVRGLVELNDGRVTAQPRGPGWGTRYVVSLPLPAAPLAPAEPPAVDAVKAWASQRVLVVDDNHDAADMLGLLLELDGSTVRVAHDGPTAVEEAREFEPEIIFMDIGIPGFDGNEAARRIRAMDSPVRPLLIALTGWGARQDRDATAASGFDLHLVKPVTQDDLRIHVKRLINEQPSRHG